MLTYLRGEAGDTSVLARTKRSIAKFLESPLGQSLPEIHMVLFMFGGRFYEMGRRITGLGYVGYRRISLTADLGYASTPSRVAGTDI